jgi:GT2 family glycosyltransferase
MLGRSPAAYALWIAREEPKLRRRETFSLRQGVPTIVPVIDCRHVEEGLHQTLASIQAAGNVQPVAIGGTASNGAMRIERPADLGDIDLGTEVWLCPLTPGERLATDALVMYAEAAKTHPNRSLIYADDDLISLEGHRSAPHFKPEWDPDLFGHHDFLTGASMVRTTSGTLSQLPEEGWACALVRSALHQGAAPLHIPRVLHHRTLRPQPRVPPKPANLATAAAAPLVSILIPTRDKVELLRACIEGLKATDYSHIESIIIDNGSEEASTLSYLRGLEAEGFRVLTMPGPFNFSALNNAAVQEAGGRLLCFLNNDVEMVDRDWLSLLVRQAVRPDIGAVGALLLYPDKTVQHAGVCIGIGGGAGHAHRLQRSNEPGYFERARLPQRVSAVTGACLVVARDKFLAVGGFDEESFPVAFNDVDLCLKLNARGWQSFYEPRAVLIHHESKSRGMDQDKIGRARFAGELAALKRKWHTDEYRDPHHNPNLSRYSEQFLIRL